MRDSLRFWQRRWLSAAAVIASIGLGTAVATATVATAHAVLWRDLPVRDADRVVVVARRGVSESAPEGWVERRVWGAQYLVWRERQDVFEDLAAYRYGLWTDLMLERGAEEVREVQVTGNFFDLLGVAPAAGRTFTAADVASGEALAVLTHAAWTRLFNRDDAVLGRSLRLDRSAGTTVVTVVGVVAPGLEPDWSFDGTPVDVFTVLEDPGRVVDGVRVLGRLRSGITREVAEQRTSDLVLTTERELPFAAAPPPSGAQIIPLRDALYGDARPVVRRVLMLGLLVVLIGCASAAGTMVTMASRRTQAMAIQQALGRPLWDVRRSLLLEGVCLGLLGGLLAIVAARVLVGALADLQSASMPRIAGVQAGWFEAGVAGLLAAACGLLVAAVPASMVRPDLFASVRDGAMLTWAPSAIRWRQALLGIQVALVLALLVAAGLMVGTLHTLVTRPLGFSMGGVLVAEFRVPDEIRRNADRSRLFVERLLAAVRTVPGPRTIALAFDAPLQDGGGVSPRVFPHESGPGVSVAFNSVSPGYVDVLGIPIVSGRDLPGYDSSGSVLVNVSFAREHYGSPAAAVGRLLRIGNRTLPPMEILGVVGDTRQRGLKEMMLPLVYIPLVSEGSAGQTPLLGAMRVLTREHGDPARAIGSLRAAIQEVDARLAVRMAPLSDRFRRQTGDERVLAWSLGVLAASSLLLSIVGIVALVGQLVTDRSRELAIRLVLGSSAAAMRRLVIRAVLVPAIAGAAAGLVLAWWAIGLVRQFLFETAPYDPRWWLLAVTILVAASLTGAWWPARRALRLDSAEVLRRER